jgi:hypothetical protein
MNVHLFAVICVAFAIITIFQISRNWKYLCSQTRVTLVVVSVALVLLAVLDVSVTSSNAMSVQVLGVKLYVE